MKRLKRTLSLLLSLVMLLSVCGAFAQTYAANNTVTINVIGRYDQSSARSMLSIINRFRAGNEAWFWNEDNKTKTNLVGKLNPYTYDYDLERIAMQRAAEIAVECDMDHHRPDGRDFWTAYGTITSIGENVAFIHATAQEAFDDWKEADKDYEFQGHRRSMLSDNFTAIGIAHFVMNGCDYWVQEFRKGNVDPADPSHWKESNNNPVVRPVEVLKSKITKFELSGDVSTLTMMPEESVAYPDIHAVVSTEEHWPDNIDINALVDPLKWSIADKRIAFIYNDTIMALSPGNTTLTASHTLFDSEEADISFNIHVHDVEELTLKQATCTTDGYVEKTCTMCDWDVTELVPATGHHYEETARTPATCTEDGSVTHTCSVCGDENTISLPKLGHSPAMLKETILPATCTTDGIYTEIVYCSVCGVEISRNNITIPGGHSPAAAVIENKTEATCTEPGGYDEVVYCSACGRELSRNNVTEAPLGHTAAAAVREKEVDPSCTQKGSYDEVIYCSVCGEEISRKTKGIAALGHNYQVISTTKATYDKAGTRVYECTRCKDSYTETIPKLIRNGWFTLSGKKYYYKNDKKLTGWQTISNKKYYFNGSGVMLTGWQKISSKWYYFNGSGVMLTGWQKLGGKWYYFNGSGVMLTGWQKISNKWYYFNSGGDMVTGWKKLGGKWYYFNSGGDMVTGWLKDGGKWYFFNTDGEMLTGKWKINGTVYQFNSSGVCLNP